MEYQWYPGHMKKAYRQMAEDMPLIDVVVEVCDARMPRASRNPDIASIAKGKGRVIILSKTDLADERKTQKWIDHYRENGIVAIGADLRRNTFLHDFNSAIASVSEEKRTRDLARGIKNRPVRVMICGIPNSGKSTFINSFSKKAVAKTGNKPGVTKGKQWIRLNEKIDLLDTPGILYPKFEDQTIGLHLALCGSINDDILEKHELAAELLRIIMKDYEAALREKYSLTTSEVYDMIRETAENRKLLKAGGVPNEDAAAALIIDDFRSAKIARISLEEP